MFLVSNKSGQAQALTSTTAKMLKSCERIEYRREAGAIVADGFNHRNELVLSVHTPSREDFETYFNPVDDDEIQVEVATWGNFNNNNMGITHAYC